MYFANLLLIKLLEQRIQLLEQLIAICGSSTSAKGAALEQIIFAVLPLYNGRKISELPFIRDIAHKLPEWCKSTVEHVKNSLPTRNNLLKGDLDFLVRAEPSSLLQPQNATGPDGILYVLVPTHELVIC